MTGGLRGSLFVLVAAAIGAGSYWVGQSGRAAPYLAAAVQATTATLAAFSPDEARALAASAIAAPARNEGRDEAAIAYYRDPDGQPIYSASPRKTADGRDFVAVTLDQDRSGSPRAPDLAALPEAGADPTAGPRILYYRNPMGLPDTSPVPKKDSMGMDYIAVYDGPENEEGIVVITPGRLQRTGVRSEVVALQVIGQPLRVPAVIRLDERRISVLTTRAAGFVEEVAPVTTGGMVRKGDVLIRIYSPDLTVAAVQFLTNLRRGATRIEISRRRLENLGVPPETIAEIERTAKADRLAVADELEVPRAMTWYAPQDGLILERMAVPGEMVQAGEVLFRLADTSTVWVIADVPERNIASVQVGTAARITLASLPGQAFAGAVDLIYPEVSATTRTVKVRIQLPNPDGLLIPDMYADVELETGSGLPVIAVPNEALIDTGTTQVVIIDRGEGRFEPRPVTVGERGRDMLEITDGIAAGDRVVIGANFLIDAESNIKAALAALDAGVPP